MDYAAIYDRLIERAKNRTLTGYSERHHIVPKCIGGSNDPDNIVRLTAPEHFVAHKLLVMMHPNNQRLVFAAWGMTNMRKSSSQVHRVNNKLYGWLREEHKRVSSEFQMGRKISDETRAKMREAAARNKDNTELKEKRRQAATGRRLSAESIAKMKETKSHPDRRAKASASHLGKKHDPATIEKIRQSKIGKPRPAELMEKLRQLSINRKYSAETIAKRTESFKRNRDLKKQQHQLSITF